jgi:hypothetical protein
MAAGEGGPSATGPREGEDEERIRVLKAVTAWDKHRAFNDGNGSS